MTSSNSTLSFRRLIAAGITTKLLNDIAVQIFHPFLPIFAAGLNSNLTTMGQLLSLRSLIGLISPIFGALGDGLGYRRLVNAGLLLWIIGLLMFVFSGNVLLALWAMVVLGIAQACLVPNLQAYVSAQLPYQLRARGIGMLEYSWALTGIVGLSVVGLLIDWSGWQAPFVVLAVGMAVIWFLFRRLPEVDKASISPLAVPKRFSIADFFRLGENAGAAYATIIAGAMTYFAASQLMTTYAFWLKDRYALDAAQLGMVALVLGIFDLCGSVSVSLFTDRIGKRVSIILGCVLSLIGYLLIPWLDIGVVPAVLGMAFSRGSFEFAIVSTISLLSEQSPGQRGKALALGGAFWQIAGAAAGLTAPWLYNHWHITGIVGVSAAVSVLAVGIGLTLVREVEALPELVH